MTPFELWTGRKLNLQHLHVWGCSVKIRIYNPYKKKIDLRTINEFFPFVIHKNLKGPGHHMRTFETRNVKFIENGEVSNILKSCKIEIQ